MSLCICLAAGCWNSDSKQKNPLTSLVDLVTPDDDKLRLELQEKITSMNPEIRKNGVIEMSQGRPAEWNNTPNILQLVAKDDPDEHVRYTALLALHRINRKHPDQQLPSEETLEIALQDESWVVRLECVQILKNYPGEKNLDRLAGLMNTEKNADIRQAIAETLRHYPYEKTLDVLIEHLGDDSFAVKFGSRKSLKKLTGQDFKYNMFAWRQWLDDTHQPFKNRPETK